MHLLREKFHKPPPVCKFRFLEIYRIILSIHYRKLFDFSACPEIVTRAGWGARAARSSSNLRTPVSDVFIHHTAGTKCTNKDTCAKEARQTQNYHMDTNSKYSYCSYYDVLICGAWNHIWFSLCYYAG